MVNLEIYLNDKFGDSIFNDERLIEKSLNGVSSAVYFIYSMVRDIMNIICKQHYWSVGFDDRYDIVSNLFLRLVYGDDKSNGKPILKKYKKDIGGRLYNYIYNLLIYDLLDFFKHNRKCVSIDHLEYDILAKGDKLSSLNFVFNDDHFSDREFDVFRLFYSAGYSNREIADILGISEKSVGTYKRRLLNKLRRSVN